MEALLVSELARTITSYLLETRGLETARAVRGETPGSVLPEALAIANDLVVQACADGFPLSRFTVQGTPMGGGNTAGLVALATLHAPFVFKLDKDTPKLAEEGLLMRRLRNDNVLPERLRESFPRIYAVRDKSPYAYLMEVFPKEDGFISLEDRLYPAPSEIPSNSEVSRWMHAVGDLLFLAYRATIDRRRQPNLFSDYIDRIKERLAKVAQVDSRYHPRVVRLKEGRELTPWDETLSAIESLRGKVLMLTPGFMTYVHGDPNPGNLILHATKEGYGVKQIDPKEWGTGDYLFDVTKITHFLEATAPAEKSTYGKAVLTRFATEGENTILEYDLAPAPWTHEAVEIIRDRVKSFAREHHDEHWELRYQLGMAANILGLPVGRYLRKPDAAAMLYGEGLKWLEDFRKGLEKL